MKIVHIEDFFHPDAGYQINILPKYLQKFGHENVIISSQMDKIPMGLTKFFGRELIEEKDRLYEEATGVRIIRLPIKAYISGRVIFTRALFQAISAEKPDILYIHGNDTFTGINALIRLKKISCPVIMDSHMLEMASTNKFNKVFRALYRRFITPIIKKNHIPVIRTQNDPYVERCLGIPLSYSPWISYGSDVMLFHPDDGIKESFRKELGIQTDSFVVVYTGKLDEAKGGELLADAFLKKFNTNKKVVLIVVGNSTGDYGSKVEGKFTHSENIIIRFPTQRYSDLAKFYQVADISVFAKQCSLSFYDAQACGLPVISEKNNINVERNSHGNGLCFECGDVADFRRKIQNALDMSMKDFNNMSYNAYKFIIENYNYEDKAREYELLISSLL